MLQVFASIGQMLLSVETVKRTLVLVFVVVCTKKRRPFQKFYNFAPPLLKSNFFPLFAMCPAHVLLTLSNYISGMMAVNLILSICRPT